MALLQSGNPALSEKKFQQSATIYTADDLKMTEKGTLNKFFILFLLVLATASLVWKAYYDGRDMSLFLWGGAIGGLITAIVVSFKPMWAPVAAPIYALFEGAFVGGISAYYNAAFETIAPNIIMQAVTLTFGTAIGMYLLYNAGVIKATERFRAVVFTATAGVALFYLIAIVLRLFGVSIPFIHEGSTIGIIFSLVVVTIAALNLIIDFDNIRNGAAAGAPKYMEWYGAFGLLVTIVWLYIEILRLLSKISSRD